MKNMLRSISVIACISTFLIACSGNKNPSDSVLTSDSAMMAADTLPYNKMADFKFSFTLANLPSPLDVINTVYNTEVAFDNTLLNPTDNSEKYISAFRKSLNYGIYGVDMAYIACGRLDVFIEQGISLGTSPRVGFWWKRPAAGSS